MVTNDLGVRGCLGSFQCVSVPFWLVLVLFKYCFGAVSVAMFLSNFEY